MSLRGWIVGVALLFGGCAWPGSPCGCGNSYETDPWTEETLSVGPVHAISAHCRCRCGDGDVVLEDPSARCESYEGDCTTPAGEPAEYLCE